ncbi:MAG: leucyl aminopeptidase [Alphaproteobacteria bacterium]|nr:leucyl aminopeptidase [Alphaproteobacteria bacterium]
MLKIGFGRIDLPRGGALAVGVIENKTMTPTAALVERKTGGALTRAIGASRFTGKKGEILELMVPRGLDATRVLLVGLGKAESFDALAAEGLGGALVGKLALSGERTLTVALDALKGNRLSTAQLAARIGYGARLASYRFDKYRTKEKPEKKPSLVSVTVSSADPQGAVKTFDRLAKVAEAVEATRDLVSEPANVIYPESFADECRKLSKLGIEVEVLGVKDMQKLGMGALLGVGQGSARESQLVVLRWRGAKGPKGPIALVGKGVCFDTGGISIKPAQGMEDMKWDMGGAAAVYGTVRALAARKAKIDVVGVLGLVENMPSGTAQRPGDVVTSMSGQTVEVINTDAEGRLVLADAMWYCQTKFKPRCVIDLATLTGAIVIALGNVHAGLFTNNDQLATHLVAAGQAEGELLWRLPLAEDYDKDINSDIADMKNVGSGRGAGSITAAQFLQRFIQEGTPWAHLDIAGMAWTSKDRPTVPKGAWAFGVRLLERMIADHYEGK